MTQTITIEVTTDQSGFCKEVELLTSDFIAHATNLLEDGHTPAAVAVALSFVAGLVAGKKPQSTAFLENSQRLARKYREVKLSA